MNSSELRDAFHYLFPDELPALQRHVLSLPPNPVVVNIGAGAGTSALAILESRPDVTLHSVDVTLEDSPFGCLYAEKRVCEQAGVGGRLTQHHGDSKEVGAGWLASGYPLVDLVFVDGDHSYEGCAGDILEWSRNLKPNGLLLIHDYNKAMAINEMDYDADTMPHWKEWTGVNEAVDELLVGNEQFQYLETVDSLIIFMVKISL